MERHAPDLVRGQEEAIRHALARSAALKAWVVSLDEHETTGLRSLLNYGHTLGHALETVTGYTHLLHGEAVAIGMRFAGALAHRVGILSAEGLERQTRLLDRFGLPVRIPPGVDAQAVRAALTLDKKVESGRVRWVLLDAVGHGQLRRDVPPEIAEEALARFLGQDP